MREQADRANALLKDDPRHPSLHLKRIGRFCSARAGSRHRALAIDAGEDTLLWVWVGTHTEYDQLLQRG